MRFNPQLLLHPISKERKLFIMQFFSHSFSSCFLLLLDFHFLIVKENENCQMKEHKEVWEVLKLGKHVDVCWELWQVITMPFLWLIKLVVYKGNKKDWGSKKSKHLMTVYLRIEWNLPENPSVFPKYSRRIEW